MTISIENAEHDIWSDVCIGWHLRKRDDLSVIRECIPTGGAESMHYHTIARQYFYVLDGVGTMVFDDHEVVLGKGQGLEIAPQMKHQFSNRSNVDVYFLVVSMPATRGDRVTL